MKKYIIILIAIFYSFCINAQNIIDPPPLDSVHNNPNVVGEYEGFIKGWNWGSAGAEFDRALGINTYHNFEDDETDIIDNVNLIMFVRNGIIGNGRNNADIFNAHGIHLEPTITVDSTENFVPREGDRTGAVYGFKSINLTVGDISSDFDRYVLTTDNFDSTVTVLKDIWDGKNLRWLDYDGGDNPGYDDNIGRTNDSLINDNVDRAVYHPFNGKQFCLSINLRALYADSVEAHLTDTILVLRMPYTLYNDTLETTTYSNVRFDRVPQQSFLANDSIISSLNHYRGIARLDQADANQPTNIYITGEMLKNLSDTNRSITLSAYAEFTGIPFGNGYEDNPIFRNDWWENRYGVHEYITEVDVEVEYYGNLDVAIDWIRKETSRLRRLMRGEYDDTTQKVIDQVMAGYEANVRNPKIWRFYAADELVSTQWSANRYYNMLVDTLAAVELYISENPAGQYFHAVAHKEFWNGNNMSHEIKPFTAAPYIESSNASIYWSSLDNKEVLDLWYGYKGNVNNINTTYNDFLDSQYETQITKYDTSTGIFERIEFPLPLEEYEDFFTLKGWNDEVFCTNSAVQHIAERTLHNYFYSHPEYIFSDKTWWGNVWFPLASLQADSIRDGSWFVAGRPQTGEETRYQLNSLLSLGAKGLIYWLKSSDMQDIYKKNIISIGIQAPAVNWPAIIPTGNNFIYSDLMGSDFINLNGDPNGADSLINLANLDTTVLGISSDRIYLGQISTRAEINKIHKWIDEYEDLIMNLKLVAWKAKGFTEWISEDPYNLDEFDYPEESIYDYINPVATRTRPIGRMDQNGVRFYEQNTTSSLDSGFYDITVHFELDSNGNRADENCWYLTVQNRRTDPLIRRNKSSTTLDFYSTAELDKYVVTGGTSLDDTLRPASWWQEKWWEKQGSREISIKFFLLKVMHKNKLVKVTELGLNHDTLKAIHTFDGDTLTNGELNTLYPRFEKVIGLEGNITANYLPGEMKLFKCEFIDDDNDLTGDLNNSNQTKLVAHPVLDSTGTETEAIQYHLVYFKTDTSDNDRVKVYYSRSEPLDSISTLGELDPINFPNDDRYSQNIIWQRFDDNEKSFIISDDFIDHLNQTANLDECDYPAIVVRKDTNDNKLKAYIIYTCRGDASNDNARVNVSALDVTNPISDPVKLSNRQIDIINTPADSATQTYPRRSHWGTPVVNASANGIYYAWSSGWTTNPASNSVIKAAFAPPDSGIPSTTLTIQDPTFNFSLTTVGKYQKFPSLNPYSDINFGEEHCSMVWVCDFDNTQFGNRSKILYTNLKLDTNGNINCLLPSTLNVDNRTFYTNTDGDLAIVGIAGNNRYPVINRLTLDLSVIFSNLHLRFERIFSEIDNGPGTRTSIFSHALTMVDLGNDLTSLYSSGQFDFINIRDNLYQPNVCQPTGFYNDDYIETSGVSDYVLNFRADNTSLYQSLGKNKTGKLDFSDFEVNHRYVALGDQVHLSQYPGPNFVNIWRNRRVFNDGSDIIANPRFFFLLEPEDLVSETFLGFSSDSGSVYISKVLIDSTGLDFYLPYDSISYQNQTGYYYNGSDTLWSEWFSVGSDSYLKFQTYGLDSTAKLLLQYSDDSSFVDLELPTTQREDSCYYINYNLKEGESYNFRMVLIGNDTNKVYKEQLLIDGIPIMDTLDYTIYLSKPIINEVPQTKVVDNNIILEITPIPAKDVVYVTARLQQQAGLNTSTDINLKLMSLDGSELLSIGTQANVTTAIQLEKYSQGVYFIRAETKDSKLQELISPVTKQFIIER